MSIGEGSALHSFLPVVAAELIGPGCAINVVEEQGSRHAAGGPSSDIARFRMTNKGIFVIGDPYGSEMWRLPFWKSILDSNGAFPVKVQMCAAGLSDPLDTNFFIQKDTWIVANNQEILEPLAGLQCP